MSFGGQSDCPQNRTQRVPSRDNSFSCNGTSSEPRKSHCAFVFSQPVPKDQPAASTVSRPRRQLHALQGRSGVAAARQRPKRQTQEKVNPLALSQSPSHPSLKQAQRPQLLLREAVAPASISVAPAPPGRQKRDFGGVAIP